MIKSFKSFLKEDVSSLFKKIGSDMDEYREKFISVKMQEYGLFLNDFILEEHFVKKKHLDESDLSLIKNAQFQKEEVGKLSDARQKREIAQYSITKSTTKNIAEKIKSDAFSFVNKTEEILEM